MADENEGVVVPAETIVEEVDIITKKDEEIAKLAEERDNYKKVALKRLGKNPADAEFLGEDGKDIQSAIEEAVRLQLLDSEIARKGQEREAEIKRMAKENSELRLALKNRPGASIGGDSGASSEVKDNVFSPQQLEALKQKALRLKADPEKFIESAKQNLLKNR